jgi:hypothetical protein
MLMIHIVNILGSVLMMSLAVSEQFTIADRQRCLARLGFDVGRIDGQWGARSQAALRAWTKQAFPSSWDGVDQQTIELRLQHVCADPPSTDPPTAAPQQILTSPSAPTQDSSQVWGLLGIPLLIGVLVGAGVLFFVPTMIASRKGKSSFGFFVYSLFLWPIALIHALVMEPSQKIAEERGITSGELRRCPFCTEAIQTTAIRCRHCGADLKGDTHTGQAGGKAS